MVLSLSAHESKLRPFVKTAQLSKYTIALFEQRKARLLLSHKELFNSPSNQKHKNRHRNTNTTKMPAHLQFMISEINISLSEVLHDVDLHRINLHLARQQAQEAQDLRIDALQLLDFYTASRDWAAAFALTNKMATIRKHWAQELEDRESDLKWSLVRVARLMREKAMLEERYREHMEAEQENRVRWW